MTEFEASGSVTIRIDNLDSVGDDVAAEVERGFGSVTMQGGGGGGRGGRQRRRARRVARATEDSNAELSEQTQLLEDILSELDGSGGGGAGGGGDDGGGGLPDPVEGAVGAKGLSGLEKTLGKGGALAKFAKAAGKGGGALAGFSIGDMAAEMFIDEPVREFGQDVDIDGPTQEVLETGGTAPAAIRDFAEGTNDVIGQGADTLGGPLGIGDGSFDLGPQFTRTKTLAERSDFIPNDALGDMFGFRTTGGGGESESDVRIMDENEDLAAPSNPRNPDTETASATGQTGSSSGGPSLLGSIGPSVGEAAATAAATGQEAITTAGGGGGGGGGTVNVNAPVSVQTPLGDGVERNLDREFDRIKREILQSVAQYSDDVSEAQFNRFQTRSP